MEIELRDDPHPHIIIRDRDGAVRIFVGPNPACGLVVGLLHPDGSPAGSVSVDDAGVVFVTLIGSDGLAKAGVVLPPNDTPRWATYDANGNPIIFSDVADPALTHPALAPNRN